MYIFIKNALNAFNFGPSFVKWVDILYKNSETAVLNNGHQSKYFKPERGVRQGCVLSPCLFNLYTENRFCSTMKIWYHAATKIEIILPCGCV